MTPEVERYKWILNFKYIFCEREAREGSHAESVVTQLGKA